MSNLVRPKAGWFVFAVVMLSVGVAAAQTLDVDDVERLNRRCMNCHGQRRIVNLTPEQRQAMVKPAEGEDQTKAGLREGLYMTPESLGGSVHAGLACVSCHAEAAELPHAARLDKVSCDGACHAEANGAFQRSAHAVARAVDADRAPGCPDCHGSHNILPSSDRRSRTYPLNVVELCGDCHGEHAGQTSNGKPAGRIVSTYLDSVHGKALSKGGLVVAATCADCHNSHDVRPASDPQSTVHRSGIPETCGQCHIGLAEAFGASIHGQKLAAGDPGAPVCSDCHTAHAISHAGTSRFMRDIVNECGDCHDKPRGPAGRSLYDTYRLSYHGQVTALGSDRAARCSDCHGAHRILAVSNPDSRLAPGNRVEVCRDCHPGANASFAAFQPHADYRDGENYPILHYIWLYFMIVITGTLAFFGLHSALWFIRGAIGRLRNGPVHHHRHPSGKVIQRFKRIDRVNHALIIVTFFGLTLTGMPLLFADQRWAHVLAGLFGGVHTAGFLHRVFAVMLMGNFVVHFAGVLNRCRKDGVRHVVFGPNSMLPRWRDVKDLFAMFRWFFGGPKPTFDRWTYWEKFDYWAEIFGTSVIGFTGLMLWFPETFSLILPGWMFNVATVVHGYEALLAVAFIFTIHFFNAHLRVEKFPVDDVMFTGRLPEAEFIEERGSEYERLKASGELEQLRVTPAAPWQRRLAVWAGLLAMLIGTTIVVLIVIAGVQGM